MVLPFFWVVLSKDTTQFQAKSRLAQSIGNNSATYGFELSFQAVLENSYRFCLSQNRRQRLHHLFINTSWSSGITPKNWQMRRFIGNLHNVKPSLQQSIISIHHQLARLSHCDGVSIFIGTDCPQWQYRHFQLIENTLNQIMNTHQSTSRAYVLEACDGGFSLLALHHKQNAQFLERVKMSQKDTFTQLIQAYPSNPYSKIIPAKHPKLWDFDDIESLKLCANQLSALSHLSPHQKKWLEWAKSFF